MQYPKNISKSVLHWRDPSRCSMFCLKTENYKNGDYYCIGSIFAMRVRESVCWLSFIMTIPTFFFKDDRFTEFSVQNMLSVYCKCRQRQFRVWGFKWCRGSYQLRPSGAIVRSLSHHLGRRVVKSLPAEVGRSRIRTLLIFRLRGWSPAMQHE